MDALLSPTIARHSLLAVSLAVEVGASPVPPGRQAPRSLAGEDQCAAPRAVAHAVRDVLPGARHREAPGAAELREVGVALSIQVLLGVGELAAGLEAASDARI